MSFCSRRIANFIIVHCSRWHVPQDLFQCLLYCCDSPHYRKPVSILHYFCHLEHHQKTFMHRLITRQRVPAKKYAQAPQVISALQFSGCLRNGHEAQKLIARHLAVKAHTGQDKKRQGTFWLLRLAYIFSAGAMVYVLDEYYYASVAQRSIRAVSVLSLVAYNYANSERYNSMEELHDESAEHIISMIRKNKGLYVKLGQAIANQGALFPVSYQRRFMRLYDDAPVDSWEEIDKTLRRFWGQHYEVELFERIEHEPIASALIAQVHRARLKDGNGDVAVKVQHPYIMRQIHADLAVYRLMSSVYSWLFSLPLDFSTQYISDQLLKEADFTNECRNSQRLAEYIIADPKAKNLNVHIPDSHPQYAASQVLVTEWIDGVALTDRLRLIEQKFDLSRLMHQYISIFARQIFDYGFVHSDPHPGNILVRVHRGTQQIVILDHGLYVELPSGFKAQYASLWRSLLGLDLLKITELADEWGIGSPELLQAMVQLKPPATIRAENAPSSAELLRMLLADEDKFPPDLIFLLRTMRMMQNLNQSMGSPINRINLLTEIALEPRLRGKLSWAEVPRYATARVTLFFSNLAFWIFRARQILLGDRYGDCGEGLEDYIDKYLKENARAIGINIADGL